MPPQVLVCLGGEEGRRGRDLQLALHINDMNVAHLYPSSFSGQVWQAHTMTCGFLSHLALHVWGAILSCQWFKQIDSEQRA